MWAGLSLPFDRSRFGSNHASRPVQLSTVAYRSRATRPLSDADLDRLVEAAEARNRAELITGMMIYDDGQILQWLEGPTEALSRVMSSISRDSRHQDIEILGQQLTPVRMYEGWNLKLRRKPTPNEASIVSRLSRISPDISASVLRFEVARRSELLVPDTEAGRLVDAQYAPSPTIAHIDDLGSYSLRLAQLLIGNATKASVLVNELALRASDPKILFGNLFEPAARALGDLWANDDCTEFDVTIGLCNLQTAMRQVSHSLIPLHIPGASRVLIAPQPGEPHMLGAVLNAEMLWQAGWSTRSEFPDTDKSLQAILAENWFDALALALSPTFQREHWLPRMAATVTKAREASRNPALSIVVSGRFFTEREDTVEAIDFDACSKSSADIKEKIWQSLHRPKHPSGIRSNFIDPEFSKSNLTGIGDLQ